MLKLIERIIKGENRIENKQIFNIKIYPGVQKPYFLKKEGIENGVYIRIGSTNRKADTNIINELQRQNLNMTYDEKIYYQLPCEYLSKRHLKNFLDKYGDIEEQPLNILIRDKYVNKTNGNCYPTVGAVLLFSEKLPPEFEYASIIPEYALTTDYTDFHRLYKNLQEYDFSPFR